jgi:hypothetical protein
MKLEDLVYCVVDQCSRRLPPASLGLPRLQPMYSGLNGYDVLTRETSLKPSCPAICGLVWRKVVKGGEEGPLFSWINIGLDSYGDPDGSTIIHFAVKVHRNARSLIRSMIAEDEGDSGSPTGTEPPALPPDHIRAEF